MAVPSNAKVANVLNEPGVPITLPDGSVAYPRMYVPVGADGTPLGGSGTDSNQVQGALDHDAPYSTLKPVGIGAYATTNITSQAAVAVGDIARLVASLNGRLMVSLGDSNSFAATNAGTNVIMNQSTSGSAGPVAIANMAYSGSNFVYEFLPNLNARLLSSAATTNATSVKTAAGSIFRIQGNNTVASKRYLKIYNKASAPTVGTDVPVATYVLLASSAFEIGIPKGMYLSAGIAFAITAAIADADTTAIGSGDIEALNIMYA